MQHPENKWLKKIPKGNGEWEDEEEKKKTCVYSTKD